MPKYLFAGILASLLPLGVAPADAAVTINIVQAASDVIATASGTLDLTGLSNAGTFGLDRGAGGYGYIGLGNAGSVTAYSGLTGPANFGAGNFVAGSVNSGTSFAVNASSFGSPYVFVPLNFLSGGSISATETFSGKTLAGLGLTAGQYVFAGRADSVTVNVGPGIAAAVPEPATWAMMLFGFGGIGIAMRRRRRTNAQTLGVA